MPLPIPAFGFVASSVAKGLSFNVVPEQSLGRFDQAGGTAVVPSRFIQAAVFAVGDDVGDTATVGAHHWAAGRHGFQKHQPESLCAGGKQEGIAAGVGTGQFLTGQIAHKGCCGSLEVFLQLLPVGPVTDQSEAGIRQRIQHWSDPFDLFFC